MLTLFSVQRVVFRFDMLCLLANVTGLLRLDCCVFFFFLAGLAVMRAGAGLDGENMHEIKNQTTDDRPNAYLPSSGGFICKSGCIRGETQRLWKCFCLLFSGCGVHVVHHVCLHCVLEELDRRRLVGVVSGMNKHDRAMLVQWVPSLA